MSERWVSLKAVAEHFDYSYQSVLAMTKRGDIPSIKMMNGARSHYRFKISEVEEHLKKWRSRQLPK